MKFLNGLASVAGLMLVLGVGCGTNTPPPPTAESGHGDHAQHLHPTVGPHKGDLIELGDEEYHAELVHDEATGKVTIYLLDAAAKQTVSIADTEISINIKHDGQGEQFKLAAAADQNDPAGESSRFMSSDKELAEDLDHETVEAQLVVTIKGKQYRGAIKHQHGDGKEGGHKH